MLKMRGTIAGLALAMGVSGAAQVMADPINFDADGPGGDAAVQANQFDWLPGNSLAIGGNQAVANAILNQGDGGNRDTSFTLLYQARLTSITNALNANVTPSHLDYNIIPGGYEITIVAAFQERVLDVVGNTVVFDDVGVPQTNNFFEVYFDNNFATKANDLAGTGFNDGKLIGKGTIDIVNSNFTVTGFTPGTPLDQAGGTDNYPGLPSVNGIGVTGLEAVFDPASIDFAHFIDLPTDLVFHLFTTTQTMPFGVIDPSAMFVLAPGGAAPVTAGAGLGVGDFTLLGLGNINGAPVGNGGGPSVQFQADASNTFLQTPGIVPEPATAALGLMGLAGLALRRRRIA